VLSTVHRSSTIVLALSEAALLVIAIGGYYRWKGPDADAATPEALSRYRRVTLFAAALAALVLVGLLARR
jgi:hypothetical protein